MLHHTKHAFHYLFKSVACNSLKCLLHIDCLLGAGFEVWDVVLALAPSLCSFRCYLSTEEMKHTKVQLFMRCFWSVGGWARFGGKSGNGWNIAKLVHNIAKLYKLVAHHRSLNM